MTGNPGNRHLPPARDAASWCAWAAAAHTCKIVTHTCIQKMQSKQKKQVIDLGISDDGQHRVKHQQV
jgi:hypothetical protein